MTFPSCLDGDKPILMFLQVENLFRVANAVGTLRFEVERFVQGVMDDPHIFLHRLPHLGRPFLDGQISPVRVREPDGLSAEIMVQVGLFRVFEPELCGLQLGYHVLEDLRRRVEEEDPGVEPGREPRVVHVDIRNGPEFEREVPELVKVPADDGVRVEVDAGLDPEPIERPDVQFRVLVSEVWVDAFPAVRWGDELDRVEFPACCLDEAGGSGGDAVGEVDEDPAGLDAVLFEGVAEDG